MLARDYLTVKVWDLNMETKPIETYQVCGRLYSFFFKMDFVFLLTDNLRDVFGLCSLREPEIIVSVLFISQWLPTSSMKNWK